MKRISIKWNIPFIGDCISGVVTIWNTDKKEYVGEWDVFVDRTSISHKPKLGEKTLCHTHEEYCDEVSKIARIYHDGYVNQNNIFTWIS